MGSPNRVAWAGVRKSPLRPLAATVAEPSACVIIFPGPDTFCVRAFPVLRLVKVNLSEPLTRVIMDPSEALNTLAYSLSTGKVTPILNPQNDAGTVNGFAGRNSHLGPRPARAGVAVTTPASRPSSAPSAMITPSRRVAPPYLVPLAECEPMLLLARLWNVSTAPRAGRLTAGAGCRSGTCGRRRGRRSCGLASPAGAGM